MLIVQSIGVTNNGIAGFGAFLRDSGVIDGVRWFHLDRGCSSPGHGQTTLADSRPSYASVLRDGLMATAIAMIAPVLAVWGIGDDLVWRISSAIAFAILAPYHAFYPKRRRATVPGEKPPLRMYFFITLGVATTILLCLNIFGSPLKPGPGPIVIAAVYMLTFAAFVFLRTYKLFLQE